MENTEIKSLLEALLFTSTEPLTLDHFISVIPDTDKTTLAEILSEMRDEWEARHAGVVLREIANGYQLFSNPRWYPQIQLSRVPLCRRFLLLGGICLFRSCGFGGRRS